MDAAPRRSQALRQVSLRPRRCAEPLELADGGTVTALEIQWEYFDRARSTPTPTASTPSAAPRSAPTCCGAGRPCSPALETDPSSLADQLDWVAKHRLLEGYRERHGLDWDDARLAAMDLQYHDLRPEKGLAARVGLERLITDAEVESGRHRRRPPDTRA